MQVLLRSDVKGLGKRGDIVSASDGFARNFLIPQGKAQLANDGVVTQAAVMRRARDAKDVKVREAASAAAKKLAGQTIKLAVRAGNEGKLFGSITNADVAKAIHEQYQIELDKHDIHLEGHIKTIGQASASVKMHAEVQFPIVLDVTKA